MSGAQQSLRIVVADDEADMREYLQTILPRLGHQVLATCGTGLELVQRCRELEPDLVISDIRMPEMDGIQAAEAIYAARPLPVILISAHHGEELIRRAREDHVLAYLVKPVKAADLEPAIAIAMRRFEQFRAVERQAADLQQALADRKTIERAKGILMKRLDLDEPQAFQRLEQIAQEKGQKLVQVAAAILATDEAFHRAADP